MHRALTEAQRAEILSLSQKYPGGLTATHLWQAAQKKSSTLHDEFEWDVESAAVAHWEHTARKILGRFEVEVVRPTKGKRRDIDVEVVKRPALVSVGEGYCSAGDIMRDPERSKAFLRTELSRIHSLLKRVEGLCSINDEYKQLGVFCQASAVDLEAEASFLGGEPLVKDGSG